MNCKFLVICFFAVIATTVFAKEKTTSNNSCLITPNSIAGIKIGMKVSEIQKILPKAKFERFEDGEGIAGISVILNKDVVVILYTDTDEGQDAPIDINGQITGMMTFSEGFNCKTKEGVGPGTLIKIAAKKLGGVKRIVWTEIEGREYITFNNERTKNLSYRVGGKDYSNAGVYVSGKRVTKKYSSESKITVVEVF